MLIHSRLLCILVLSTAIPLDINSSFHIHNQSNSEVSYIKLLHLGIDIAYGSTCGVADAGNPMKIELPF